jgi:hypothetical protein
MAGQHVVMEGRVGPEIAGDGSDMELRLTRDGAGVVQELHGRFFEQNYRGAVFSAGMGMTSISNATYTTGTLTNASPRSRASTTRPRRR